jgi:outer membrane protein TolC
MLGLRYFIFSSLGAVVVLTPSFSSASQTTEIAGEPTFEAVTEVTDQNFDVLLSLVTSGVTWVSFPEFLQTDLPVSSLRSLEQVAQMPNPESEPDASDLNINPGSHEEPDTIPVELTSSANLLPEQVAQIPTFEFEPRIPDLDVIPGIDEDPDPDRVPVELSPSSNPLYFPTQPEQVEIDLTQPITLEQALEIARQNNQDIQIALYNIEAAEASLEEALASYYPNVNTNVDLQRIDSADAEISIEEQQSLGLPVTDDDTTTSRFNTQIEASYDLYTGGRRPALVKAAEEQLRLNQLDFERVAEELRLTVALRYYELQRADALVEVAQADVEEAQQSLRDAQLLEEAGLGTRFDVLRAEVQLANADQSLERTIADQLTNRRALVDVLGLGGNVTLATAEEIEKAGEWVLSLPESIVLAYRNRAELEQQLAQREINQQQIEIALAGIRPNVNVFSSYNILDILDDDVGTGDGFTLGARMQWTLYDGGAAKARARQEEANVAVAESQFDDTRNQVRLEVEQAFYDLQANEANIETTTRAVELAEESLRLARLRFQAGVGTQTDVIAAQSDLTEARVNLVQAIIDYNRAFAQIRRAVSNVPDNALFDFPE